MRQLRTVGMCIVATLAIGVAGVSTAQSAEVGECLKLEKVEGVFHGEYVEKNCQVAATPLQEAEGKHNKWQWSPGVTPAHSGFTAKTTAVEWRGAAGTIECKKSSTVGGWTGRTTSVQTTTYEGCEFKGGPSPSECHSAGQREGTVVTNQLAGTLLGHGGKGLSGGEPAEGEVWDSLVSAEPSGIHMEYLCAGLVEVRTLGSIAGVYTAGSVDVMSGKDAIEFNGVLGEEPGKFGEQDLSSEASIGGGPFEPAGQGLETTTRGVKNSGKIEIRS